jgi:hypothetical protein
VATCDFSRARSGIADLAGSTHKQSPFPDLISGIFLALRLIGLRVIVFFPLARNIHCVRTAIHLEAEDPQPSGQEKIEKPK